MTVGVTGGRPACSAEDPRSLDLWAARLIASADSVNTAKTYRSAYRSLRRFLGGDPPAAALTAGAVEEWCAELERAGRAPSTIAVYRSVARALGDLTRTDPALSVVRPGRPRSRAGRDLAPEELERLLHAPPTRTVIGRRDLAILSLFARGDLRSTQIAHLRTTDRRPGQPPHPSGALRLASRASGAPSERIVALDTRSADAVAGWCTVRPQIDDVALFTTLPVVAGRRPRAATSRGIKRIIERHAHTAGIDLTYEGAARHAR